MLKIRTLVFIFFWSVILAAQTPCPPVQSILDAGEIPPVEQMINALKSCEAPPDSIAWAYYNLAKLHYFNSDLKKAIENAQLALDRYEALYVKAPNPTLGNAYHLLGAFNNFNESFEAAQPYLERAVAVRRQTEEDKVVQSYLALANNFTARGAFEQAAQYFQLMLDKAEQIGDTELIIVARSSYGNLLNEFQRYETAKTQLERADQLLAQLDESLDHANCWLNLAVSNYHLQDYPTALKYYQKAVQLYDELEDCDYVSLAYSGLGRTLQQLGQSKQAINILEKGLEIANICEYKSHAAMLHDNLGECYLENGEPGLALAEYQRAIRQLLPTFAPEDDYADPRSEQLQNAYNKVDLLVYLSDKARAIQALASDGSDKKLLQQALAIYKLGDQLIDQMRQEHRGAETKLFWRSKVLPFYENAIRNSVILADADRAFYFFEKSKAILLLEALQEADALANIPDSCSQNIRELSKGLYDAQLNLEASNLENRPVALQALLDVQRALSDYEKELAKRYPNYRNNIISSEVIDLKQYQNADLIGDGVSIHYFYGVDNIYALVVTSADHAEVYDLGPTAALESTLREYLSFFQSSTAIENAPQEYLGLAHELYHQLLAPLNLSGAEEILIYPDGALAYLPFESLIKKPADNLSEASYLIRDHIIRYAYSAAILAQQTKRPVPESVTLAAFAPFASADASSSLSPLTFSNDELAAVKEFISGDFWWNEAATLSRLHTATEEHQILHLSTHAFSSATSERPRIAFADTMLYLEDLYQTEMPVELVVLSACQTNIGPLAPGEGVFSLGRGFTHAGARSLVSSLWKVNARATGTVLAAFYEQLQRGTPKYKALHLAKRSYLDDPALAGYERSPYYWAGLVYFGGPENLVVEEKSNRLLYGLVITGLAVILLLGWLRWRRR